MAIQGGPDLINQGLLLCLDASDRNSYPGTGSTWYDLSGNANHCTINGATFSSANNGSFNFNGSSNYVQTPLNVTLTTITYEFWSFFDDVSLSTVSRNESAFGDWVLTNNQRVHFGTRWSVGMHFNANGTWEQTSGSNLRYGWNHYLLTYNGSVVNTKRVYLNGIQSSSHNSNGAITMDDFKIGNATGLNQHYRGNISMFRLYNNYLTSDQALQHYNNIKGRYDL